MDSNIKDYLAKSKKLQSGNVTDCHVYAKYDRNISNYCTSTVKVSISWGTVKVTTRNEKYYEKFI